MVILKRVLFFVLMYAVAVGTWGTFLVTPGSWFDSWYLRKFGSYGPLVMGTNYQPITVVLFMCAALAFVMTWLVLAGPAAMRRLFAAGPRIGPLTSGVPLAIPRGRRRRVRP